MKEIWQFKKTIVDSEPYYIDNLNIWEFEWKNTGETIQIQDPLYKQNYSFNVYEISRFYTSLFVYLSCATCTLYWQ